MYRLNRLEGARDVILRRLNRVQVVYQLALLSGPSIVTIASKAAACKRLN